MRDIFKLIRVRQWLKNGFVGAGFIFAGKFSDPSSWAHVIMAFFAMSFVSSATYVVNDIIDVEKDRLHPKKSKRPIASGRVAVSTAWGIASICLILGIVLAVILETKVLAVVIAYLLLQAFYNMKLKHTAVSDVACIALGFILRVVLGVFAVKVYLSAWIILCTASIALLLGFGKRRHEFLLQGTNRGSSRAVLRDYSQQGLDALVTFSAALAAMSYGLYSIESPTAKLHTGLFLTTPIVWYGICRYVFLIFSDAETGEPETIVVKDIHIVVCFVLFAMISVWAITSQGIGFLAN
jgi:4-hydroxybenzoate polyprenyltransferase